MKYCEYCGKQVIGELSECPNCGANVVQKIEKPKEVVATGKYCIHCGSQILPEAVICPKCGCAVGKNKRNVSEADKSRILQLVTKIFMMIALGSCIVNGIGAILTSGLFVVGLGQLEFSYTIFTSLIPLVWIIPMTMHYFKATKNKQPITTGFKVCTLIFVSFVAGILMFCESSLNKSDVNQN